MTTHWHDTQRWQQLEREADEDLVAGRYEDFDSIDAMIADMMRDPEFRREYERLGPVYEPLKDGKPRSWLFWRWFGIGNSLRWPDWYIRLGKRLRAL